MDVLNWFLAGWHWLLVLGAMFSIFGIIYVSCSFLGKAIPKKITQAFAFMILGLLVGIITSILADIIILTTTIFAENNFNTFFKHFVSHPHDFITYYQNTESQWDIIYGMLIGILIGLLLEPIRITEVSKNTRQRKMQVKTNWDKNIFLWLFAFLMLILTVILWDSGYQGVSYIQLLIGTSGFIFGFKYDKSNLKFLPFVIFSILLYVSVNLVLLFSIYLNVEYFAVFTFLITFAEALIGFILGYILGALFNQTPSANPYFKDFSWKDFILLMMIGLICGFAFPLISRFIFLQFPSMFQIVDLAEFSSSVGLLIAFGYVSGNELINRLRAGVKRKEESKLSIRPGKNTRERFVRGFLIASIYYVSYIVLFIYDFILAGTVKDLPGINLIPLFGVPAFIFIFLSFILSSTIILGSIVGAIYSGGPTLSLYVDGLSEKRMLQIGVVLAILGVIALVLPALFG